MPVDTIFALATPEGRGGVSVIRVSGAGAQRSIIMLTNIEKPVPRYFNLCKILDPVSRETLDHALVVFFAGPASFTGEDVAEYHLHGGRAVTESVLRVLSTLPGHRLAEPGEFTRRAFENGKIDLTAAEAIADLIDAETAEQKNQAMSQLEGGLSRLYDDWRGRLLRALAHLEADIDFPDEDLPQGVPSQVAPVLESLLGDIEGHLKDNRRGERLRSGFQVAIIGAPNAGKSSLINALAQREVAIVSPHAGTTRDVIEAHLDLGGFPVILADTAGLRAQNAQTPEGMIEAEGMRRAGARAAAADIKILLFDATVPPDPDTLSYQDDKSLVVFNKTDLGKAPSDGLAVSAKTGQGLETLTAALVRKIREMIGGRSTPSLTRERHRTALESCRDSLRRARLAPAPELAAEDVRLAVRALGRITGRVDVEDLLDVIFRDFCIGK